MTRKLLIVSIALSLIVGIGGYIAYWFMAASQLERQTLAWIEDRRAAGYAAAHGDIGVSGFPGAFTVSIDGLALGAPDGSWRAAAPQVTARSNGPFGLGLWTAESETARIEFGPEDDPATIDIAQIATQTEVSGQQVKAVSVDWESADIRYDGTASVGGVIDERLSNGRIAVIEDPENTDRAEIVEARLDWNDTAIEASGNLGADAQGYLTGDLTMDVQNLEARIDAMREAGWIGQDEARFVIGALALAPRTDSGAIQVPIQADGRRVMAFGFVALFDAPRIYEPDANS